MHKYKKIIVGIICLLFIIFNYILINNVLKLKSKISNIEIQMSNMKQEIVNQLNGVQNEVSGSLSRMEQSIEKQSSIVSEHEVKELAFNEKDKTVTYKFTVKPKEFKNSTEIEIIYSYDDQQQKKVKAVKEVDGTFTSTVTIPLCDTLQYGIVIKNGQVNETESLDELSDLKKKHVLTINAYPTNSTSTYDVDKKALIYTGGVEAYVEHDANITNKITEMKFYLRVNDKRMVEKDMLQKTKENKDYYVYRLKNYALKLNPNDVVEFVVEAKDSVGFIYESIIERNIVDSNHFMNEDPNFYYQRIFSVK